MNSVSNASPFIRQLFEDRPDYLKQVIDFDGDRVPESEKLKPTPIGVDTYYQAKRYNSGRVEVITSDEALKLHIYCKMFRPRIDMLHEQDLRFYAYWKEQLGYDPDMNQNFRQRRLVVAMFKPEPSKQGADDVKLPK